MKDHMVSAMLDGGTPLHFAAAYGAIDQASQILRKKDSLKR